MDDRTLVTVERLDQIIGELSAMPRGATPPALEHEPVLRELIGDHFRQIAGHLVLSSVPAPLIRTVMRDVDRLLTLSVTALRVGYKGILNGMLADDGADDWDGDDAGTDRDDPSAEPPDFGGPDDDVDEADDAGVAA